MSDVTFQPTPREFLEKLPRKTAADHERDRALMEQLPQLPEAVHVHQDSQRQEALEASRRALAQVMEQLRAST